MTEDKVVAAQTISLPDRERRTGGGVLRWLGVGWVAVLLLFACVPGVVAPYSPTQADPSRILLPPSQEHWLGTDINGMDVLSRIVWAARIDITIAVASTAVAMLVGTAVGAWAGFHYGRRTVSGFLSDWLMRAMDAIQSFPVFVLALALVAVLGRNIFNLIYVLIFVNTPLFLRLTRSSVIRTREELFVDAARASGNSEGRTLMRHVLPNSLTPTLVNGSVVAGGAILLTAGLSFVGAGVPAPTAEWGYMVAVGAQSLYTGQWWPALFPGIAIGLAVLSFAQLGDMYRLRADPTRRIPRGMLRQRPGSAPDG